MGTARCMAGVGRLFQGSCVVGPAWREDRRLGAAGRRAAGGMERDARSELVGAGGGAGGQRRRAGRCRDDAARHLVADPVAGGKIGALAAAARDAAMAGRRESGAVPGRLCRAQPRHRRPRRRTAPAAQGLRDRQSAVDAA